MKFLEHNEFEMNSTLSLYPFAGENAIDGKPIFPCPTFPCRVDNLPLNKTTTRTVSELFFGFRFVPFSSRRKTRYSSSLNVAESRVRSYKNNNLHNLNVSSSELKWYSALVKCYLYCNKISVLFESSYKMSYQR